MSNARAWVAAACVAAGMSVGSGASRGAPVEVAGVRTPLPGEGYLEHKVNPAAGVGRFGNELTGWVDIRHPALNGTTSVADPFDRSNHFINTHSILVTDSAGQAAAPDVARDWDRSSKIYAQAGLSTPRISSGAATLGDTWANFDAAARRDLANAGTGRAAAASTLNLYYAKSFAGSTANGLSIMPQQVDGVTLKNPYSYVRDGSADSTGPHEAGHQLLNGNALHMEDATPSESSDAKNWMFRSGANYGFPAIGRDNGRIEPVQLDRLYANGGANNPGFVQKVVGKENYGNRVDWDFVGDHRGLENRPNGADDHQGTPDSLYFEPGNATTTAQTGHDHAGLGEFAHPGNHAGTFRYADVFSVAARYADFDRTAADGDFSQRNGALDYDVVFVDAANANFPGVLETVFAGGWTENTSADNFLGRWRSPVDAVAMFVLAKQVDGVFDGNAQIDAVIVSNVPEPAATALAAVAVVGWATARRCRRCTAASATGSATGQAELRPPAGARAGRPG